MPVDELDDLSTDRGIGADVFVLGKPSLQESNLPVFLEDDAHRHFGREFVVWAIEGNRGNRVTAKASLRFPLQSVCSASLSMLATFGFHTVPSLLILVAVASDWLSCRGGFGFDDLLPQAKLPRIALLTSGAQPWSATAWVSWLAAFRIMCGRTSSALEIFPPPIDLIYIL
jgi:hypothetical protein